MLAGRPVVYTTFLAYDEVAHHSGIERPDTLRCCAASTARSRRIAAAAEHAPRPYRLVVLSDHGQSQGATFLHRYGVTLEDARPRRRRRRPTTVAAHEPPGRGARLPRRRRSPRRRGATARRGPCAARRAPPRGRRGAPRARRGPAEPEGEEPPEIVVMASGCLGLDLVPARAGARHARGARGALPRRRPRRCATHPGHRLPARALRGARRGRARRAGSRYLDEDRVEGEDPLAPFGPNAARARPAHRRLPALPGHRRQQHLLGRARRGRRVRGARRLARRDGRRRRRTRSCCTPTTSSCPRRSSSAPRPCTASSARWLVQLGHPEYGEEPPAP